MQFLPVLCLLVAGAFAAPADFDSIMDGFHPDAPSAAVEETPAVVAPVEPETAPEAPAVEPAVEAPAVPETPAETPAEETPAVVETPEVPEVVAPAEEPAAPVVEEPAVAPAEEPVAPAVEPTEPETAPAVETEATETETAPAVPVVPAVPADTAAEKTDEATTEDDDNTSGSSESSNESDEAEKTPAEASAGSVEEPAAPAAEEPAVAVPETPKEPEAEVPAAAATDVVAPEAEPEVPVVVVPSGNTATVDGVTIKLALQATWLVAGERRRGYVAKIANNSEKELCGVTFTTSSKPTDIWNLTLNEDGSLTTKDLKLAPGANANQFGYASSERSRPTITAVTFC